MNIILHLFINHSGEMFFCFSSSFYLIIINNPFGPWENYTICAGFMFSAFSIVFRQLTLYLGVLIIFFYVSRYNIFPSIFLPLRFVTFSVHKRPEHRYTNIYIHIRVVQNGTLSAFFNFHHKLQSEISKLCYLIEKRPQFIISHIRCETMCLLAV